MPDGSLSSFGYSAIYGTGAAYGLHCPIAQITLITLDGFELPSDWVYWGPLITFDAGAFPTNLPANWFAAKNFNVAPSKLKVIYVSSDATCHA